MPSPKTDRQWRTLLADDEESWRPAPSSLKARLYSAVISQQQETGLLASLDVSVADGHDVCVRQLDLAHFDHLIWPTPGSLVIGSLASACAEPLRRLQGVAFRGGAQAEVSDKEMRL